MLSGFLVLGLGLSGCGSAKPPAPTDTTISRPARVNDPLLADVSRFRPAVAAPAAVAPRPAAAPTHALTAQADNQLADFAEANKSVKYAQGYRILAYTGGERAEAMRIRTALIRRNPDEHDYLQFQQPTYRLKIGDYLTRLEAEQALVLYRDIMPNSLIVAEQVNVQ